MRWLAKYLIVLIATWMFKGGSQETNIEHVIIFVVREHVVPQPVEVRPTKDLRCKLCTDVLVE